MQKINYQAQLDKLLENLDTRPKLLLHVCCGPCSSYVMEYLAERFEITLFFYNPNIYPETEYLRRRDELFALLKKFPPALKTNIRCVEENYNSQDYFDAIKIKDNPELANEPEKGERCRRCYEFRLKRAYEFAAENHFDYFCTSLSISPFKDSEKINVIGKQLESDRGDRPLLEDEVNRGDRPLWLVSDFKKKGGFKRSLEISSEYGMYRQSYCGCVYSYNDRKAYDEKMAENK